MSSAPPSSHRPPHHHHMMKLFVKELNPMDVLLGRGTGPNDHEGNQMFRDLIDSRLPSYVSARSRDGQISVIKDTISVVYARGGRFLRKVHTPKKRQAIYEIVTDMQVLVYKAKQSFRYSSAKSNKGVVIVDPNHNQQQSAAAPGGAAVAPAAAERRGDQSPSLQQQQMGKVSPELPSPSDPTKERPNDLLSSARMKVDPQQGQYDHHGAASYTTTPSLAPLLPNLGRAGESAAPPTASKRTSSASPPVTMVDFGNNNNALLPANATNPDTLAILHARQQQLLSEAELLADGGEDRSMKGGRRLASAGNSLTLTASLLHHKNHLGLLALGGSEVSQFLPSSLSSSGVGGVASGNNAAQHLRNFLLPILSSSSSTTTAEDSLKAHQLLGSHLSTSAATSTRMNSALAAGLGETLLTSHILSLVGVGLPPSSASSRPPAPSLSNTRGVGLSFPFLTPCSNTPSPSPLNATPHQLPRQRAPTTSCEEEALASIMLSMMSKKGGDGGRPLEAPDRQAKTSPATTSNAVG